VGRGEVRQSEHDYPMELLFIGLGDERCDVNYCENWIEHKLRERLNAYKKRYPLFKVERVMDDVLMWEPKLQRWSPYMTDKDIASLNRRYHKSQSLKSLATNENW